MRSMLQIITAAANPKSLSLVAGLSESCFPESAGSAVPEFILQEIGCMEQKTMMAKQKTHHILSRFGYPPASIEFENPTWPYRFREPDEPVPTTTTTTPMMPKHAVSHSQRSRGSASLASQKVQVTCDSSNIYVAAVADRLRSDASHTTTTTTPTTTDYTKGEKGFRWGRSAERFDPS
jgi:hypothetical protein